MADEDQLHRATVRASQAQALLSNELLIEAFEQLEASYIEAWKLSPPRDVEIREKFFQAVHIVGKVRDHLQSVLDSGKLAANEINALADKKKRFGVV